MGSCFPTSQNREMGHSGRDAETSNFSPRKVSYRVTGSGREPSNGLRRSKSFSQRDFPGLRMTGTIEEKSKMNRSLLKNMIRPLVAFAAVGVLGAAVTLAQDSAGPAGQSQAQGQPTAQPATPQ